MDYTRIEDLKLIQDAMKMAKTRRERDRFEKMAHRMINVSVPIKSLREDLAGAIRVGDRRAVERLTNHIHAVKLDETRGKSIGSVKGEEIDRA